MISRNDLIKILARRGAENAEMKTKIISSTYLKPWYFLCELSVSARTISCEAKNFSKKQKVISQDFDTRTCLSADRGAENAEMKTKITSSTNLKPWHFLCELSVSARVFSRILRKTYFTYSLSENLQ